LFLLVRSLALLLALLFPGLLAPLGFTRFVIRHAQEGRQSTPSDSGQDTQDITTGGRPTNPLRDEIKLVFIHIAL